MTPLTASPGRADALNTTESDVADTGDTETLRRAVLLSRIRDDRFCPTPAHWTTEPIRAHQAPEVGQLDLADCHIPAVLGGNDPDASPPEQVNSFFPEWQRKPVGFISCGGTFGGMESMWTLCGVFAEFDAVWLSDSIAFPNISDSSDQQDRPIDAERMAAHTSRFLDQFAWWVATLREGRRAQLVPRYGNRLTATCYEFRRRNR